MYQVQWYLLLKTLEMMFTWVLRKLERLWIAVGQNDNQCLHRVERMSGVPAFEMSSPYKTLHDSYAANKWVGITQLLNTIYIHFSSQLQQFYHSVWLQLNLTNTVNVLVCCQSSRSVVSLALTVGCLTIFGVLLAIAVLERSLLEEHLQNITTAQEIRAVENNSCGEYSRSVKTVSWL